MAETWTLRAATQGDGLFLGDMVVEAANWRAGAARPRHEIMTHYRSEGFAVTQSGFGRDTMVKSLR